MKKLYFLNLLFLMVLGWLSYPLHAQINLVPNPGFEDIIDCSILFGEIHKAEPWLRTGIQNPTPDLYHACADEDSFYGLPIRTCDNSSVYPRTGEGMAGLVNIFADEKIYARLLDSIPTDHDIYISFANFPSENCNVEFGNLCNSNTQSLAFDDRPNDLPHLALSSDTILNNFTDWTILETCYRADGTEKYVFLGNYQSALKKEIYCDNTLEANFSYSYVDDVVVAAFDVVPDTIIICAGAEESFSIDFFGLQISWADGFTGGIRTINQGGTYIVEAATTNCVLQDEMVVIKIPEQGEVIEASLCDEATLTLTLPVPGLWDNGIISANRIITVPGNYGVELLIDCEEENLNFTYEVVEVNCGIEAFVPDIFSPNADGINDELKFYFNALFSFKGELNIFDRWGNHLFRMDYNNASATPTWDGQYKGSELNSGVYIWVFRYQSMEDLRMRVIAGDVTIVK